MSLMALANLGCMPHTLRSYPAFSSRACMMVSVSPVSLAFRSRKQVSGVAKLMKRHLMDVAESHLHLYSFHANSIAFIEGARPEKGKLVPNCVLLVAPFSNRLIMGRETVLPYVL